MEIKILEDADCLRVVTAGIATIEGIMAVTQQLQSNPRWNDTLPVIIDHRALDMSQLDADTIGALAARHADARIVRPRAIVVSDATSFGVARIWQSNLAPHLQAISAVFTSMADAEAWLHSFNQP